VWHLSARLPASAAAGRTSPPLNRTVHPEGVKTFGLQECNGDGTSCTSEFGNYPHSPAGAEKIHGQQLRFTAGHPLPDAGNTNFGTAADKLVGITTRTGADRVYVYNPTSPTPPSPTPSCCPAPATAVADVPDLPAHRLDPDRTRRLTPTAQHPVETRRQGPRAGTPTVSADDELIRLLADEHGVALYAFCVRFTGDRQRAEDVVQEVLLRAWRQLDTLQPDHRPVRPWLFTVARNLLTDQHRAAAARPRLVFDDTALSGASDHVRAAAPVVRTSGPGIGAPAVRLDAYRTMGFALPRRSWVCGRLSDHKPKIA